MNQDTWNTLTAKLAESEQVQTHVDQLQATLTQLRGEIQDLAGSLQQELAELRSGPTSSTPPAEATE